MPISDNECDDYDMDYKEYGSGLGGGGLDMGGDLGGDMVGDLGANGLPMSKAEQRRSNKPIMEKRRRARINHCLNELKSLILDAMKKDPARHSKLEKADILEMTVKHLQNVQRQQVSQAVTTDPHTLHKFKAGFNECASEVSRYVSRMDGLDAAVRQRLVAHLSGCVQGLQQIAPFSFPGLGQGLGQGLAHAGPVSSPAPSVLQQVHLSGDINNNNNNVSSRVQSLQLIPSRLPTGELALLLPNSGQLSTASLLFPAPATPAASATADTIIKASPLSPRSPHPSAFTAVGNLSALGSVAATPPSSDAASASASASGSASSSPDTPPSSARALQLARVAADSSTSSSPESTSSPCLPSQVHVRPHGRTSPTSSSVEIKLEPKLEPFDGESTPRASGMHELRGLRGPGAIDFSLKRCASDGSETEADAEGEAAPPCKVPRYMLGVTSAPATSTGLGGHYLPPVAPPGPAGPSLASPAVPSVVSPPAARAGHAQPQGDDKADRDMWRPW